MNKSKVIAFAVVGMIALASDAWAYCFTQSYYEGNRYVFCQTCCAGTNCTTTCN